MVGFSATWVLNRVVETVVSMTKYPRDLAAQKAWQVGQEVRRVVSSMHTFSEVARQHPQIDVIVDLGVLVY